MSLLLMMRKKANIFNSFFLNIALNLTQDLGPVLVDSSPLASSDTPTINIFLSVTYLFEQSYFYNPSLRCL